MNLSAYVKCLLSYYINYIVIYNYIKYILYKLYVYIYGERDRKLYEIYEVGGEEYTIYKCSVITLRKAKIS